mmetsp:Transcript_6240/g.9595  ORF Transcript_6240/g.9595 Transcript_6240/m.9595 type:complete len:380 (+) Transcript_6240:235-1374(+)|eukprot:CAMPEP_0178920458 /NCGR_PEP_ID=MMETSP0786-20121207/15015_1 /TAXON_ID=186022 /ORGANISM="Thalassionema frauenfeldii, Strain CCMP 1798" /LENGTH=379 /DNA_ID=CAMNT_0020594525 /DNA_START=171 /DNA_END=1310 /DNA_ORIENTATION=+
MSSSTLVNVAEDAENRLVALLAGSGRPSFVQDCEQCLLNGDAAGLLKVIISDQGAMNELLNGEEASFSLLAALLERVSVAEQEVQLADALATAVETQLTDKEKQLRLLSALYNLRSRPHEKCGLLVRMVALAPSLTGRLGELVEDLVNLLDGWSIDLKERRPLYRVIAQKDETKKQKFTLLLVETYTDASQIDKEGLDAAREAAIGAIRDPVTLFQQQRSMLSTPVIKALAGSNDTKDLYNLLEIFQEGKLQEYRDLKKDDILSKYGLNEEECTRNMRILSLCSLAAECEEVPYNLVATTLDIEETEVESWVIAAVSSGLLSAKMDQIEQRIMVERSVVRKFDMAQWKALQSQLEIWKHNVNGILGALKQSELAVTGTV